MTPANDNNDRILVSLNAVVRMTSLSRTAINKKRGEGTFPKDVPLGDRRIAFVRTEVEGWISDRIARREAASATRLTAHAA
jgi:prophage regulatory protein